MGFRFRKSVKILPGVRLNFSKSGVSTTLGVRGASVNIGRRGTYRNTGIPGTGISHRERIGSSQGGPRPLPAQGGSPGADVSLAVGLVLLVVALATCAPDTESRAYSSGAEAPAYSSPPVGAAAAVEQTEGFYAHSALNVRSEPSTNARIVRTLARGDYMELGARDENGWAGLYTAGVREGYVHGESDAVRRSIPAVRADSTPQSLSSPHERGRSSAESRGYYTGPRGGCYTYTASGRKRYVDRSFCD